MVHHFPTLPVGVMQIYLRWQVNNLAADIFNAQRAIFSFINQNPFPPGWFPPPLTPTIVDTWIDAAMGGTVPFDTTFPQNYVFIQGPTNYYTYVDPFVIPAFGNGYCTDPALCVTYSKFASPPSRNHTGRMALFPIPSNYIDGGGFTVTALLLYRARAIHFLTPIVLNTVIFAPCIFSPALGTYTTLDRVELIERPTYVYRRRAGRRKFSGPWTLVP